MNPGTPCKDATPVLPEPPFSTDVLIRVIQGSGLLGSGSRHSSFVTTFVHHSPAGLLIL